MSYTQRGDTETPFAVCGMTATGLNKQVDNIPVTWISTGNRLFAGKGLVWGVVPPTGTAAIASVGCTNQQITDNQSQWGGAWCGVATARAVSDDAFVTYANGVNWAVKGLSIGYPNNIDAERSRISVIRMQAP